nr:hypothetical protein [uncultured Rhodoferax sp.]
MTILYVEDEIDFREQLIARLNSGLNISSIDVGKFTTEPNKGETALQFQRWLQTNIAATAKLDGVILDSDLSGYGNGISKETLLAVFRAMGIPVCRYSKRTRGTTSELLKHFATLASEGAASILVPSEFMNGGKSEYTEEHDDLVVWLEAVFNGFSRIHTRYDELSPQTADTRLSPPALLAKILDNPSLELDFLGYGGANLFFFGDRLTELSDTEETAEHEQPAQGNGATKLGYWLHNYIISFPGPILNVAAAAAFMGVKSGTLNIESFAKAMAPERYDGPFGGCQPLFLRERLEETLIDEGVSGVQLLKARGVTAEPIYEAEPTRSGVYCIATNTSIETEDGVGPIDFIPGGASDLCRVSRKTYQRWIPWLNL